jgi:hypothetical protein
MRRYGNRREGEYELKAMKKLSSRSSLIPEKMAKSEVP